MKLLKNDDMELDWIKAYSQIPNRSLDIEKTALTTAFLFDFFRMPFGLTSAGRKFQQFNHDVVQNISDAFVYSDNIWLASSDFESHLETPDRLLTRLSENGLLVNLTKCKWIKVTVEFLEIEI